MARRNRARAERSRRRIAWLAGAATGMLLVGAAVYLAFADLGRHRGLVEQVLSGRLGGSVSIEGAFHLRLLPTTTVSAERLRLSAGEGQPVLLLDRLRLQLDPRSLVAGPLRIRSLSLGRLRGETRMGGDALTAWSRAALSQAAARPGREAPVTVERLALDDARFDLAAADGSPRASIRLDRVRLAKRPGDAIEWSASGHVRRTGASGLEARPAPKTSVVSFRTRGRATATDGLPRLETATIEAAGVRLDAAGRLGDWPYLEGGALELAVDVPDPAASARRLGLGPAPATAIAATARITKSRGVLRVERIAVDTEPGTMRMNGSLRAGKDNEPTGIFDWQLAVPDPARAAQWLRRVGLPAAPLEADGRLHWEPGALRLEGITASLGGATGSGSLALQAPDWLNAASFTVNVRTADAHALIAVDALRGRDLDVSARGRVAAASIRLSSLRGHSGAARFSGEGTLGLPPSFRGTDLQLRIAGESLEEAMRPFATARLPASDFAIAGRISGHAGALSIDALEARIGETVLRGAVTLARGPPPRVSLDLEADALDLRPLRPDEKGAGNGGTRPEDAPAGRLIPDAPLRLPDWPADLSGRADVRIGHLQGKAIDARDARLVVAFEPGRLAIDRLDLRTGGGRMSADASIRRRDGRTTADLALGLTGMRLTGPRFEGIDPARVPRFSADVRLSGSGETLRELAASADGRIRAVAGPGEIPRGWTDHLTSAFLVELLRTLNPFGREDPVTRHQCSLFAAEVADGILESETILLQTDRLVSVSELRADLELESIEATFRTSPREGLGLSAARLINPFIRVTGTLTEPRLALSGKGAIVSGGAAAITRGLSVYLAAIVNRLKAHGDACTREASRYGLALPAPAAGSGGTPPAGPRAPPPAD